MHIARKPLALILCLVFIFALTAGCGGKDKDNPLYKKFLKAYQSDEVKKFVTEQFKGSVIVAW